MQQQRELSPYLVELDDELRRYESARDDFGNAPLELVSSLQFEDVGFSYMPGQPALRGITFDVRRGEAIGIVGPSGAGKTTLMQLVLRLRRPTVGTVQVNGQPYDTFGRDDWYRHVALVPQDARLVSGTVADNIRFFATSVTRPSPGLRSWHISMTTSHPGRLDTTRRSARMAAPSPGAASAFRRSRVPWRASPT